MANHASAKKRIRRNARSAAINRARVGRVRTYVRKLEAAIASGDKGAAQEAFKNAQPEMQRGAQHGVLRANTVARKLSRLSSRIKSMS